MARGLLKRTALRWLFLAHRWTGIAACLLFVMWFCSGVVMLYVPYPALSPGARWAGATPIDWAKVDVAAPTAAGRLLLEMRDVEPVWRIEYDDGAVDTVPARSAAVLPAVDAAFALRVASRFSGTRAREAERLARDQWTVAGGFDRHRPLWKVALDDAAGTVVYVSSATGLPVQRTTAAQRFWNWLGAVPHWLYPTILRQDGAAWRQVVLWVAGPCVAVGLTGVWIGVLRARFGRRRYKAGRISPYRGWMLWHHISGLAGGMFLLTWIVSGWLSVDPGRLFTGTTAPAAALRQYRSPAGLGDIPLDGLVMAAQSARTVEITSNAGLQRISIDAASHRGRVLDAKTMAPPRDETSAIVASAAVLVVDGRLWRTERLDRPDSYWSGGRVLPVLRLRYSDPSRSWLYVDPATGELLGRQDRARRLYRWCFDLLHTWDWPWFDDREAMRKAFIWLMSFIGLVLSASGARLGIGRLSRSWSA